MEPSAIIARSVDDLYEQAVLHREDQESRHLGESLLMECLVLARIPRLSSPSPGSTQAAHRDYHHLAHATIK